MKQYSANIAKGKEIIEHYMQELRSEGITFVERWQRPENLTENTENRFVCSATDIRAFFKITILSITDSVFYLFLNTNNCFR